MTELTSCSSLTKANKRSKVELTKSNLLFRKQIPHHQKKTKAYSKGGLFPKSKIRLKTKEDSLSFFFKVHMRLTVWMSNFLFQIHEFQMF